MSKKITVALTEKVIEEQKEKIKQSAQDIREKYPEIAKMTVAEVVATDEFTKQLENVVRWYQTSSIYAFLSLRNNKTLEPENFKKEYISCIDKESKLPFAKRIIIIDIVYKGLPIW